MALQSPRPQKYTYPTQRAFWQRTHTNPQAVGISVGLCGPRVAWPGGPSSAPLATLNGYEPGLELLVLLGSPGLSSPTSVPLQLC